MTHKNNMKKEDFRIVYINHVESMNTSFRQKLEESIVYRNKYGLGKLIKSINEDTLNNYCYVLLLEIKEILSQNKDFEYDNNFFFNHTLDYYINLFKDSWGQNCDLLQLNILNPLLELNYTYNHIRLYMNKNDKDKKPILFMPAQSYSLKNKTKLVSYNFVYDGNQIDIFMLNLVKNPDTSIISIQLPIIKAYITPFLTSVSLTKLYTFLTAIVDKAHEIKVDFETILLCLFMRSPLELNLTEDLCLWLYNKINYFLSLHIIAIIFSDLPSFTSISYYKNTNRYIHYLSSNTYYFDYNYINIQKFKDFISWNIKIHHNIIYDYLNNIVIRAKNILHLTYSPYNSDILPSDIELLRSYLSNPLQNNCKESKKATCINSFYLLNIIINDLSSKIFLSNVTLFVDNNQQIIRYIKECCLLLSILDICLKISSLNDNASFDAHKTRYASQFYHVYNRDHNNYYEYLSLDIFYRKDTKLSNKSFVKILNLLSHMTVYIAMHLAKDPILDIIKNYENFKK